MEPSRPLLQVIIASTRPGRVGGPTGRWIAQYAEKYGEFEVEIVDLADVDLPMFAEPEHPQSGIYSLPHTKSFSALIGRARAFVFVFPEYNHSYNAALKNALDHLGREWADKPAGLVSYGGVAAGARAAVALEPVLLALAMHPVAFVPIPFITEFIHDNGTSRWFEPNAQVKSGATAMLDRLLSHLVAAPAMPTTLASDTTGRA